MPVKPMSSDRHQSEISDSYNEWAETYDSVQNRTRDLAAEVLRKTDLNLAGREVIEVGCGTGRNTEWLARQAGSTNIVGMDFSEAMLARAQARVRASVNDGRVRFIQHDVQTPWPLAADSADVVIAMLILEHVEQLEPVFAEAARVLRAAGEFFVCELHPERQLQGKQARFTNAKTGESKLVTAFLHRVEDYLQAGTTAGFERVELAEWRVEDEDAPPQPPRLLSLHFHV
ncbi:MAG TPA: methyltransferase domain-containing protein [Pyrinomonadaceae bacterium]|nr:methyltransferase domain-containing protein [Pyrinomonadaceae bacterium]